MKIVMIRHTKPDVPDGVFYGQTDVPLASTFEDEAALVKKKLEAYRFDAAYCSTLTRCKRLAAYCGASDVVYDPRLMEINFGEWEMRTFNDRSDPRLAAWYADYVNVAAPGGESFADQCRRLIGFLTELRTKPYETVAIFTHGGIIMHAMVLFGKATPDTVFNLRPDYGAVMEFDLCDLPTDL